jgi:hypothetical protein
MLTFFLTFLIVAGIMTAMAIGLIFRNKPIKGTCASLGGMTDKGECMVCGKRMGQDEQAEACDKTDKVLYYPADSGRTN